MIGPQPVRHRSQGEPSCRARDVADEAGHGALALAFAAWRGSDDLVTEQIEQRFAARVAHDQPLLAFTRHVADGDVGEHVGVVHAGPAGEGEEIRRQLGQWQHQERHGFDAPVRESQLHVVIGAEFEVGDAVGIFGDQAKELVKPLGRGVVRAGCSYDVDLLEAELPLKGAQGKDLAGDADQGDFRKAACTGGLQQGEQRRA